LALSQSSSLGISLEIDLFIAVPAAKYPKNYLRLNCLSVDVHGPEAAGQ